MPLMGGGERRMLYRKSEIDQYNIEYMETLARSRSQSHNTYHIVPYEQSDYFFDFIWCENHVISKMGCAKTFHIRYYMIDFRFSMILAM